MSETSNKRKDDIEFPLVKPDVTKSIRELFDIDSDMEVPAFSKGNDYVPLIDKTYCFDEEKQGIPFKGRSLLQSAIIYFIRHEHSFKRVMSYYYS